MGCGDNINRQLPGYAARRLELCAACEFNDKGICAELKKLHPDRDAIIDVGILKMEAWCPDGKWGQVTKPPLLPGQRPQCSWCQRYFDGKSDICPWCRAKAKSESRNARKGLMRDEYRGYPDPRNHEIVPMPFTGKPVKHLHFFLYPRYADATEYHISQLEASIDLFNGRRVCCLAVDGGTVQDQFADRINKLFTDVVQVENDRRKREAAGFVKALELLETRDVNSVICFAHGKGQQEHTHNSHVIRRWSDAMYETCVRNWKQVRQAMEQGYPLAGSFRSLGAFRTRYRWHYSGAFWWGRAAKIFSSRDWPRMCHHWWAAESYVGKHWTSDEGYCLFGDHTGGGSLYHLETWERLDQELQMWRESQEPYTCPLVQGE